MVTALEVNLQALLRIVGGALEVAQAHTRHAQQVQAVGLDVAAVGTKRQRLAAILQRQLILLLVVIPLRSPVPHLLSHAVDRCSGLELNELVSKLLIVVRAHQLVGQCDHCPTLCLVELLKPSVDGHNIGGQNGKACHQANDNQNYFLHLALEIGHKISNFN